MRTRILIIFSIIIIICLALLFRRDRHSNPTQQEPVESVSKKENMAAKPPDSSTVEEGNPSNAVTRSVAEKSSKLAAPGRSNDVDPTYLAAWQAPIEFYGKVLDEESNVVPEANVHISWIERPTEDGERTTNMSSDAQGLFALYGKVGSSLQVSVSKEGYYASRRLNDTFHYGVMGKFVPDPVHPVIFTLHKKSPGEKLIHIKQNYRISRDGTPIAINLTTGQMTSEGHGDIVVRCWTDDAGKQSAERYEWRCVVAVPGGGLLQSDEEFPFLAPAGNYLPSAEINMTTDRKDWNNDVDLNFYYQLSDGRYGRMKFSMIAGGHHFCMIDSLLNPSGSRNLEPQ